MKSEKNILIAFLLNLIFSLVEIIGGIFTGSIAILSDAVHDFGDATSIGLSFFLEKKSKKQPNDVYTYGYTRYSLLGAILTTFILIIGSGIVVYNAVIRFINPVAINYDTMLFFALLGFGINLLATYFTHGGSSLNQKAVNLHMLEDVLGWAVVLIGALIMRFTDFYLLDPLLSIGVAVFILFGSFKTLKEIFDIFLIKTPKNVDVKRLKTHILSIDGVLDAHHIHVWTIDGKTIYATLHIVVEAYNSDIKNNVKAEMQEHGIAHVTIETETKGENCLEQNCVMQHQTHSCHHGHIHH